MSDSVVRLVRARRLRVFVRGAEEDPSSIGLVEFAELAGIELAPDLIEEQP
jgi:hypothetical protein